MNLGMFQEFAFFQTSFEIVYGREVILAGIQFTRAGLTGRMRGGQAKVCVVVDPSCQK